VCQMLSKLVTCCWEGSSAKSKYGSMEISPLRRQELWCTAWIKGFYE